MREIEVKAKLRDKTDFLRQAQKLGVVFESPIVQSDTVFECALEHDDPNWNIFRLRNQNGSTILTMKHKASDRSRDNFEYETSIGEVDQVIKILERLGYKKSVSINKKRSIAKYNDLELCLDEVEELGSFVEIERMAEIQVTRIGIFRLRAIMETLQQVLLI